MIASGSIVKYVGALETTFTTSSADIERLMAAYLDRVGFSIVDFSIATQGLLDEVVTGITALKIPFTLSAEVKINSDFASVDDVKSIIDHAYYVAAGKLPLSSSIVQATGISEPTTSSALTGQSPISNFASSVKDTVSSLGTDAVYLIVGLVAVIIVAVAVLAYSPVGKTALKAAL